MAVTTKPLKLSWTHIHELLTLPSLEVSKQILTRKSPNLAQLRCRCRYRRRPFSPF
ncbi:hypothetical protein YC2023_044599 [Brassica napus]